MQEQHVADDQSHYEISLTAGQAFVAFVLLLLSLASAFAFGLMIGRGQPDERLIVRRDTPIVTEAALATKKSQGEIVELGVPDDDFEEMAAETATTRAVAKAGDPVAQAVSENAGEDGALTPPAPQVVETAPALSATHYAQLLSTLDQKVAESLAVKLIDGGFTAAYVERSTSEKGPVFRVRVRFDSEADARSAETKLRSYSSEVWITSR